MAKYTKGEKMNYLQNEREVKRLANQATRLVDLLEGLGYAKRYSHRDDTIPYPHAGSGTSKRIRRIIGAAVYNELTSGRRLDTPKARWTRLPINKRNS